MKRLIIFAMVVLCHSLSIQNLNAQEIRWTQNLQWDQIKSEAKLNGKFIFIDCYATWCMPCKKMDKEVYTNDSVADFFNAHFVCLKLQMDSTGRDNEQIKSMYGFVREVNRNYQIKGFPTLLFFTPDGLLINKELGFMNSLDLVGVAKDAMSPARLAFYKQIEAYKIGQKDYSKMKSLALFVQDVLGDKVLSKEIANDYINYVDHKELLDIPTIYFVRDVAKNHKISHELAREYLTSMTLDSVFTKSGFGLIADYSYVLTTSDRLFQILKANSFKLDSVTKRKSGTNVVLERIITKEELQDRLVQDGKLISSNDPDWSQIKEEIASKYSFIDINKLVLDFQIIYYRIYRPDWAKWAKYKQERIRKYPPNPNNGVAISIELNDGGAWDAFLNCNDKKVLRKTLPWIDLAIRLSKVAHPDTYPTAYLDTKANVLYKMGKDSKAIEIESEIIRKMRLLYSGDSKVEQSIKEYSQVLEKMKQGMPTYIEEGAKWNNYTLPKKQDSQISSSKR